MACKHRFYSELNLEKLDYEPEILIIGTFNPEWPENNYADWFYGRTRNNYFWEILPYMMHEKSMREKTVIEWKLFCKEKKIAITDLISSLHDADKRNVIHFNSIANYKDTEFKKHFKNIEFTDIKGILKKNPTIKKVFFTRQSGESLFDNELNKIMEYCSLNGIYFSYLLTPSAGARFQMKNYVSKNLIEGGPLINFIYENWTSKWNERV